MQNQVHLLLVLTDHTLDLVEQQFGDFNSQIFAITKAHHTVYAICDKWPEEPIPDLNEFDGIIFSGSAAMLDEDKPWMRASIQLMLQAIKKEIPLLGICFGHQLLGKACQALVGPNPLGRALGSRQITVIKKNDPLLRNIPFQFWAQTSHRDVVLSQSPHFEVLAQAPHDPFHIIKAGKNAYGVQFHPEWNINIMKIYLETRKSAFDNEWGEKATEKQLANSKTSDEASSILSRFVDICRQKNHHDNEK